MSLGFLEIHSDFSITQSNNMNGWHKSEIWLEALCSKKNAQHSITYNAILMLCAKYLRAGLNTKSVVHLIDYELTSFLLSSHFPTLVADNTSVLVCVNP